MINQIDENSPMEDILLDKAQFELTKYFVTLINTKAGMIKKNRNAKCDKINILINKVHSVVKDFKMAESLVNGALKIDREMKS